MISYIKGTLEYVGEGFVIVETMGVGYKIFVSANTIATLPQNKNEIKIYTYMSVKEDGVSLFGFERMDKLELFNKLISVSGVGPKSALSIIGEISASDLIMAIVSEDIKTLGKLPGVGKKTAQRLIIDLKDKFKNMDYFENVERANDAVIGISNGSDKADAMEALLALGYSRSEALKAISDVYKESMDAQTILKFALKSMIK